MGHLPVGVIFTHNGRMLFCPIKLGALESDAPLVAARWEILDPLFRLAEIVQGGVIWMCSATILNYEPCWYFKVTGERRT